MNVGHACISNALTIDVEEYFHPTEVQAFVHQGDWGALPSRVEPEVQFVLDLLEQNGVCATFFILGWVAERRPSLIRMIVDRGHEVGCHSYAHHLVFGLTPTEFRDDTLRAVATIADACGVAPRIYRAPSYSITREAFWALETLIACGFTHDSSIYPVTHDRYGIAGFERHAHILNTPSGSIMEVPVATVKLPDGRVAPIGGGGYLRLLPYRYTAAGIRSVNNDERQPVCIYFHPWETDPYQPRLATGLIASMRTYTGLRGMHRKLGKLLKDFSFSPLTAVFPKETRATAPAS